MNQDFKALGFYLLGNADVELHSQAQLQHLANKKVIGRQVLDYNRKLSAYLASYQREQTEEGKARHRKLTKELNKMHHLNQLDKINIINNRFANEAELLLKVQNCENLTHKERKTIVDSQ